MRYLHFMAAIPFCMFMIGYIGTYFFVQQQEFVVPDLCGKNIQEAIVLLSSMHVGVSLLSEKEDSGVAEGIILNQIPSPGCKIRAYKNILVAVSKRPQAVRAPCCLGKSIEEAESLCKRYFFSVKIYYVASSYQKNTCFAQYPEQGSELVDNKLVLYVSSGSEQLYVFPDFTTILRADAEKILKPLSLEIDFFEEEGTDKPVSVTTGVIVEQNPRPGTIFHGNRLMYVQFRVR